MVWAKQSHVYIINLKDYDVSYFIVVYFQFTNFWQGWKFTEILGRADNTGGACHRWSTSTITFQNGRQHIESFLPGRNIIMYISSVRVLCERWRFTGILWKLLIGMLQQVAWAQWAARNMTGGTLKCEERIFIHHAGLVFADLFHHSFLFQFFYSCHH